jgi:hypothetical protein
MNTEVIVETVYDTIIVDESSPNTILVETPGEVTVITVVSTQPVNVGGGSSTLNISGDSGTDVIDLSTDTLAFVGGTGLTSAVTNNTVTLNIDSTVATLTGSQTLTNKTISGQSNTLSNIANTSLTNSSLIIGSTTIALGATSTTLAGLTELTVDNLNINGNTITSINVNGDITLDPNGTGNIAVSGAKITGLAEPTQNTDAATKSYVDNIATPEIALKGSFGITIDGGGTAITTGLKGYVTVPYNCTIQSWSIVSDISGSIVVDLWKDTYDNYPPTIADTITGTEKPTLISSAKNQDLTLTSWTTSVVAGDIIAFYVNSASTLTRVNLTINTLRT